MNVTLFTSNKRRHISLINRLTKVSKKLYVIQECIDIFPGVDKKKYTESKILRNYLKKVELAEKKIFPKTKIKFSKSCKIQIIKIPMGKINFISFSLLKNFFKSDKYIVYGSSFIKGKLANFLIKNKAINIHMGISPYYRGSSCNFWAMYDNNPHLIGATIHFLSKVIDKGKIIYHATSELHHNYFIYSMLCVKSALKSVTERIVCKKSYKKKGKLGKQKLIRVSKKKDFDETVIKNFKKNIEVTKLKKNSNLLIDPYILKKKNFFK